MWPLDIHLRDDAYYYFVWAENLASGEGPCVTQGIHTSGIHLLWGLLLTALSFVAELPSGSVWLGLVLHLCCALAIYLAANPDRYLGLLTAALYLGSHFLTYEAMNGQETAAACLCLALFLLGYQRSLRAFFLLALLAVAARSDLIFFVVALAMSASGLRAARLLACAGVLACYASWNFALAGHWLQDSAMPIPWLMAEEFRDAGTPLLERWEPHLLSILKLIPFRQASTPLAIGLWVAAAVGLARKNMQLPLLLLGGLALVGFHSLWREYPRDYYFAPLGVAAAFGLVNLCRWHPRWGVLLAGLACLWNGKHLLDDPQTRVWQREMWMAGRFVDRFLDPSEALGCFNSGIVTWGRSGRVVNLDGVVNSSAFAALKRGALLQYIEEEGVHYLLDNPVQFATSGVHSNGRHFGAGFDADQSLKEMVRFVVPGDQRERRPGMDGFRLYRLRASSKEVLDAPLALDLGPAPGGRDRVVLWSGRSGQALRITNEPLLLADVDCVYVLQVPWDGRYDLRLFVDDSPEPVLTIAQD